jgi:hypothetical protein
MKNFIAFLLMGFWGAGMTFSTHSMAAPPESLKACLKSALSRESPLYAVPEKTPIEGLQHYLVMVCDGQPAKDLYLSIPGAGFEADFPGKAQGEFKYLGESGGSSMCYRVSVDAEGQMVNEYHCSIRLGIDSRFIGASDSRQMAPYSLK